MKYLHISVFVLFFVLLSGCIGENKETGGILKIPGSELWEKISNNSGERGIEIPLEIEVVDEGSGETETPVKIGIADEGTTKPPTNFCGNGKIDNAENCANCPADVNCSENEICVKGVCAGAVSIVTNPENEKKVDVKIGSEQFALAAGDSIVVGGRRSTPYWENLYVIKLVAISSTGTEYGADFELQNPAGETISQNADVRADEMLTFYDNEGNEYLFNTLIWVVSFRGI